MTETHAGMELGYARVSTTKQSLERQIDALTKVGIPLDRLYVDKRTGATFNREGFKQMLAFARPGDMIVVYTIDRLGRNLREVLNVIHDLRERGVHLRSLADPLPIDTRAEGMGELTVVLLGVFAEMERIFTRERAAHARAVAAAAGRHIGRPRAHSDAQIEYAQMLRAKDHSLSEIVKKTGIPKSSLRRYLATSEGATRA